MIRLPRLELLAERLNPTDGLFNGTGPQYRAVLQAFKNANGIQQTTDKWAVAEDPWADSVYLIVRCSDKNEVTGFVFFRKDKSTKVVPNLPPKMRRVGMDDLLQHLTEIGAEFK